jgi:hypothetical protein
MNYRNPQLLANGGIDCEIEHPVHGWIPFTCNVDDTSAGFDTAALRAEMEPYALPYVPPTQEELDSAAADAVRQERDYKLSTEVDPAVGNALRWSSLDADTQAQWAAYRQVLLDVPQQSGFPDNVTWPTKP